MNGNNSLKINEGNVSDTEKPVYVGDSKVADSINGRLTKIAVSVDGDWVWVRFAVFPSEKWEAKLKASGFTWSRKRKAHHAPISENVSKILKECGATSVNHYKLVNLPEPRKTEHKVERITGDLDEDKAVEDAVKAKSQRQPKVDPRDAQIDKLLEQNAMLMKQMTDMMSHMMMQQSIQRISSVPKPEVHYSNGYHVGGVQLG